MLKKGNQHTDMQWLLMSVNANEEMLVGYADPDAGYSDADPDAT